MARGPHDEWTLCPPDSLCLVSHSADQTRSWGRRLALVLEAGDIVCLVGELGAGKTCLVQGLGQGLGIDEPVVSPTFMRLREYRGGSTSLPMYHIDLYRVEAPWQALGWGLEEYLYGEGVCAVEWAERAGEPFPPSCVWVQLQYGDEADTRLSRWWGEGDRGRQVLRQFVRELTGR